MAVLDVSLGDNQTLVLDKHNADDTNVLNINAIGDSTIIAKSVDVTIAGLVGVEAGSNPTFIAQNGTVTLDQGLLNVAALTSLTFGVHGIGNFVFDGSTISTGLTNLLTNYTVNFAGDAPGTFTYNPPPIAILDPAIFTVTGMQPGDEFNIGGNRSWALDTTPLGGAMSAYRGGFLYLESNSLVAQDVVVKVPMTQAEANKFFADQASYFNPTKGVFIFPGEIMCFGEGSLLLTGTGYRPVEHLRAGDQLVLFNGEADQIRWIGFSDLDGHALDLLPNMIPIRLRKDCFAPGYPFTDLVVSPQHRILVNSQAIKAVNGGRDGLIAAKHLVGVPGIEVDREVTSIRYYHVLMSRHELLFANGLPTESLLLGPHISRHIARPLRDSIARQLPEARNLFGKSGQATRYSLLTGKTARAIGKRHGYRANTFFCTASITADKLEPAECA